MNYVATDGLEARGQFQVWLRKEIERLMDLERDYMIYEMIWGIPCGPIEPKPQWGWGHSEIDGLCHLFPANRTVDLYEAHSSRCGMYCSEIEYGSNMDIFSTCVRCRKLSLSTKVYDVLGIPYEMRI